MTLQLCVSPCAHAGGDSTSREPIDFPDPVVRGSPDPARSLTGGLPEDATANGKDDPRCADDVPSAEPSDSPDDDGHWEEFDPAPLESWILDDFDWEIQESFPHRGDYWDDSLDGEWDVAGGAITNGPPRRASSTSLRP